MDVLCQWLWDIESEVRKTKVNGGTDCIYDSDLNKPRGLGRGFYVKNISIKSSLTPISSYYYTFSYNTLTIYFWQVFDGSGSFLSYINTSADPLYGPQGLALTSDGHVVVADSGNHCFKVYRYLQ